MEVTLRRKPAGYGGWWRGLGDDTGSGETATEGSDIPGTIDFSSGEVDPSTYYPAPGSTITTTPGVEMTPEELAAEQARAADWLKALPNVLNATTKVALTTAQITAGVNSGALKPSTTCPGGYLVAGSGQCVSAAPAAGGSLVAGLPNSTLALVAGGFLLLMILSKSGGRR